MKNQVQLSRDHAVEKYIRYCDTVETRFLYSHTACLKHSVVYDLGG